MVDGGSEVRQGVGFGIGCGFGEGHGLIMIVVYDAFEIGKC